MSGGQGGAHRPEDRGHPAGDSTRSVHAGRPPARAYEPSLPGPVFVSHFHLPGEAAGPFVYGRDGNPTWEHLERAIGELEAPGDEAVTTSVFASGMAAVSAVLLSQVRAGQTVLLVAGGLDLSVGAALSVAGLSTALTVVGTGSTLLGVLAGLAAGTAIGTLNGALELAAGAGAGRSSPPTVQTTCSGVTSARRSLRATARQPSKSVSPSSRTICIRTG